MPYAPKKDRQIATIDPSDEGELAYHLTLDYLKWFRKHSAKRKFKFMAALVGTVVLSLLEFWRRVVIPYEKKKIKSDGDVF